jgi:hypothetical protein
VNGSAGIIRKAACAAFLLFAAVLLAVAPAEASLPKSAGAEQLGAALLADAAAPLERASLTSSRFDARFGLGEDLSVFDAPNAEATLGLCGLETRRCEITYALNNPVNFTDPTGLTTCRMVGMTIQCGDSAEVTAPDPAFQRFKLWTYESDSRSSSAGGSAGGWLKDSFTNNQLPGMYAARADKSCADEDYVPCALDLIGADLFPRNYVSVEGLLFAAAIMGGGPELGAGRTTYLYQKLSAEGAHLKFGITYNPAARYTAAQLAGGRLKLLAAGPRADMLGLERALHSTLPLGPEERQLFYRLIQRMKGLKP